MSEPAPQSYADHRRFVPGYHFVAFGLFLVNLLWALYQAIRYPSAGTVIAALTAVALIFLFFYARLFALTAQDRVIRLEERLRLTALLGEAEAAPLLAKLSAGQLIGLRFAADDELPALARAAAAEGLGREQIKKRVKSWRADDLRV
jgi:hypothetical protein